MKEDVIAAAYGINAKTLGESLTEGLSIEDEAALNESIRLKIHVEQIAQSQAKNVGQVIYEAEQLLVEQKERGEAFVAHQGSLKRLKNEALRSLVESTNERLISTQYLEHSLVAETCRDYLEQQMAVLNDDLEIIGDYEDEQMLESNNTHFSPAELDEMMMAIVLDEGMESKSADSLETSTGSASSSWYVVGFGAELLALGLFVFSVVNYWSGTTTLGEFLAGPIMVLLIVAGAVIERYVIEGKHLEAH